MDSDISKQRTNCIFFNVINYDVAHLWQLIVTSLITNKMTFMCPSVFIESYPIDIESDPENCVQL